MTETDVRLSSTVVYCTYLLKLPVWGVKDSLYNINYFIFYHYIDYLECIVIA